MADQAFTININDVDEFDVTTPVDVDATTNQVAENSAIGTAVGVTAFAADADATTNSVTYSLTDSAGGRFAIDPNTGVVTVASAINREAAASYDITVRATSADGSTADQVVTIFVGDVDEFDIGPVSDIDGTANSVAENAVVGSLVGITASAVDPDATNNGVSYSLDDDASGRFAIDASSGVVTVNAALDYESAVTHTITVRASSADGSTSVQTFTINVTDINEASISPIVDSDAASDFVFENSSNGTAIGLTAFADDADGTETVTYSLDNDAGGRFAIDPNSGIITVSAAIDRETASSHTIIVRTTSSDLSTITRSFSIAIGDIDEFDVSLIADSNGTIRRGGRKCSEWCDGWRDGFCIRR